MRYIVEFRLSEEVEQTRSELLFCCRDVCNDCEGGSGGKDQPSGLLAEGSDGLDSRVLLGLCLVYFLMTSDHGSGLPNTEVVPCQFPLSLAFCSSSA